MRSNQNDKTFVIIIKYNFFVSFHNFNFLLQIWTFLSNILIDVFSTLSLRNIKSHNFNLCHKWPWRSYATHHVLVKWKYIAGQRRNWCVDTRQSRLVLVWKSFSFKMLESFKKLKTINAVLWLSWQIAVAPPFKRYVNRLVIAWNQYKWTLELRSYLPRKDVNTHHFSSSSLVCLSDKNGGFGVIISQIAWQSNSLRRVNLDFFNIIKQASIDAPISFNFVICFDSLL